VAERIIQRFPGQLGNILDLPHRVQAAGRVVRFLGLGMRVLSFPVVDVGGQGTTHSVFEGLARPVWPGQPVLEGDRLIVRSGRDGRDERRPQLLRLGPGYRRGEVPECRGVGNAPGDLKMEPVSAPGPVSPRLP